MTMRGAIFDQDGLLFDTEKIYQANWIKSARLQGVEIDPDFPKLFCGTGRAIIAEMSAKAYPALDIRKFCDDAVSMAWNQQLQSVPEKKPGVVEILQFCKANDIKTAVASSSTRKVVEHNLETAGIAKYFDAIVCGEEVTRSKPAPDIFLLAAQRIDIPPHLCCVFEDAFSGIQGANAAGMSAVLIPDQREPTDEIRAICRVYPTLRDAIAVFAGQPCGLERTSRLFMI